MVVVVNLVVMMLMDIRKRPAMKPVIKVVTRLGVWVLRMRMRMRSFNSTSVTDATKIAKATIIMVVNLAVSSSSNTNRTSSRTRTRPAWRTWTLRPGSSKSGPASSTCPTVPPIFDSIIRAAIQMTCDLGPLLTVPDNQFFDIGTLFIGYGGMV